MRNTLKLFFVMIFLCWQMLCFEGEAAAIPTLEEESSQPEDLVLKNEAPPRRAFQHIADLMKRVKLHQFYGLMGKRAKA